MHVSRRVLLAATTTALVSCGSSSAAGNPQSGIVGTVVIGPTCPVQRLGAPCTRPYATTLLVLSARRGRVVARVRSSRSGHFRVTLPSGRYFLRSGSSGPARARPVDVTVQRNRYTRVTVEFDSGIR